MDSILQKVLWQESSILVLSLSVQGEICTQRKHTMVSKKIFIKKDVLTKVREA